MADAMQFSLVSPERSLAAFEVTEVQIPGADGDMTAMPDHAPVLTTLRPGVLRAISGGQAHEYVVTGGFAQIGTEGVTVLAERALARDADADAMRDLIATARDAAEAGAAANPDATAKLLADLAQVSSEIGN